MSCKSHPPQRKGKRRGKGKKGKRGKKGNQVLPSVIFHHLEEPVYVYKAREGERARAGGRALAQLHPTSKIPTRCCSFFLLCCPLASHMLVDVSRFNAALTEACGSEQLLCASTDWHTAVVDSARTDGQQAARCSSSFSFLAGELFQHSCPGILNSPRLQMAGHGWEDWFEREEFIGQISDIRVQNLQGRNISATVVWVHRTVRMAWPRMHQQSAQCPGTQLRRRSFYSDVGNFSFVVFGCFHLQHEGSKLSKRSSQTLCSTLCAQEPHRLSDPVICCVEAFIYWSALSVYSTYAVPDRYTLFKTSTLKIILKREWS